MVIKSQLHCAFNSLETGMHILNCCPLQMQTTDILDYFRNSCQGRKKTATSKWEITVSHWHFLWAFTILNLIKALFLKSGPKMEAKMFPNKLKFLFHLTFYLMIKQRQCAPVIQLDLRGLNSIFLLIYSQFLATASLWTSILSG